MRNYVTTYDPFFDMFFPKQVKNSSSYLMDTDILEKEDHYELKMNLPNVNKDNLKVSLEDGYLKVEVTVSNDTKEDEENYIIRERKYGSYQRSFYIGKEYSLKDVSGKLNEGVLNLTINKPSKEESSRFIDIQ